MSISYYCFINNKFLQFDDYIGIYSLVEPNELFSRKKIIISKCSTALNNKVLENLIRNYGH
ncbi:hypothetical protein IQ31_03906 [Sphingobacterium siyangense]|uniref:Uncharacterized protein n=1 Tax=Sphingobacterium siyangense TaxID=459529 RepID=A0A562MB95_9SPHI|nr:hypothetical protein IQ31_03906 [Sphingobacterium siyangense]